MSTPVSVHKEKQSHSSSSSKKPPTSLPFSHSTKPVIDVKTLRTKDTFVPSAMKPPEPDSSHQNSIEECIIETFNRLDAQNVGTLDEEDSRMSIIENPLSEGVRIPRERGDLSSSDFDLLNSRVEQLAR